MEEEKNETGSAASQWIKDNLRIIVSIIIVIAIAGGIYSYSKRTQPPVGEKEKIATEEKIVTEEPEKAVEVGGEDKTAPAEQKEPAPKEEKQAAAQPESKETEGSFVETAERGNGVTHLARRALANYLEKNPDSALTPEHKIYVEDYLRKNVEFKGRVFVGTSVEFNKNLIHQAIERSKQLNDKQLNNLHKYAVKVPSLS